MQVKEMEILPNRNREGEGCKPCEMGNDTVMVFLRFWPFSNSGVKNDEINFLETNQKNSPSTPWEIVNFFHFNPVFTPILPKERAVLRTKTFWDKILTGQYDRKVFC